MLTVYLNLDNKISAEVPDLCLDLIKFTVEKKIFIHPNCSKHTYKFSNNWTEKSVLKFRFLFDFF